MTDFDVLADYWLGALDAQATADVEEQLFADPEVAERLEVIAMLGHGLVALARAGLLRGTLTLDAVDELRGAGLRVREYTLAHGETVPCTIANEDLMIIRLAGAFEGVDAVDVDLEWRLEGEAPRIEPHHDLLVDRRGNEVVLVYGGAGIRALPRAGFTYRVHRGGRPLGEFHLEHTPPG